MVFGYEDFEMGPFVPVGVQNQINQRVHGFGRGVVGGVDFERLKERLGIQRADGAGEVEVAEQIESGDQMLSGFVGV